MIVKGCLFHGAARRWQVSISCRHLRWHYSYLCHKKLSLLQLFHSHVIQLSHEAFPMSVWSDIEVFPLPVNRLYVHSLSVVPVESLGFITGLLTALSLHSPCSLGTGFKLQFVFRFCDPHELAFSSGVSWPREQMFYLGLFSLASKLHPSFYTFPTVEALCSIYLKSFLLNFWILLSWLHQCPLEWVSTISIPLRINC